MTLEDLARLQAVFSTQMSARKPLLTPLSPWLGDDARTVRRFARYGEAVRYHHERSLKLVFPVLNTLVGDAFFQMLADVYGDVHPSRDGDLARFGADFPEFIESLPVTTDYPYFPNIARLEWLLHEVHGAPDTKPLSAHEVKTADPAELGKWLLCLHPAARPYTSEWRTASIWLSHKHPLTHPLPASIHGPTRAIVYRSGWTATVRETGVAEWVALMSLSGTATLGDVLVVAEEHNAKLDPHAQSFDPATLFANWLTDGLLVKMPAKHRYGAIRCA